MTFVEIKSFGVFKDKELGQVLSEVNRFLKGLDQRTSKYLLTRLRPMSSDKLFCYVELLTAEDGEYFLTESERASQMYEAQAQQQSAGVDVPVEQPKPKPKPVPKPKPKVGV